MAAISTRDEEGPGRSRRKIETFRGTQERASIKAVRRPREMGDRDGGGEQVRMAMAVGAGVTTMAVLAAVYVAVFATYHDTLAIGGGAIARVAESAIFFAGGMVSGALAGSAAITASLTSSAAFLAALTFIVSPLLLDSPPSLAVGYHMGGASLAVQLLWGIGMLAAGVCGGAIQLLCKRPQPGR